MSLPTADLEAAIVTTDVVVRFGRLTYRYVAKWDGNKPHPQRNHPLLHDLQALRHKEQIGSNPASLDRITIVHGELKPEVRRRALADIRACFKKHGYELARQGK